ncbi:hypothetical protein TWF694_009529 [Orbilia ellipsospora]|uniref:Uncharacterized protein n=1 Tax=Orbilia ellipsospora TaxID=2528407 RepID=A0AAV9XBF2_9PEZI
MIQVTSFLRCRHPTEIRKADQISFLHDLVSEREKNKNMQSGTVISLGYHSRKRTTRRCCHSPLAAATCISPLMSIRISQAHTLLNIKLPKNPVFLGKFFALAVRSVRRSFPQHLDLTSDLDLD